MTDDPGRPAPCRDHPRPIGSHAQRLDQSPVVDLMVLEEVGAPADARRQ